MSLVGKDVESELNNKFMKFTTEPKNSNLNFKVKWYRKNEQLGLGSSIPIDNCIQVSAWVEQNEQEQAITNVSTTRNALEEQNRHRKNLKFYNNILRIGTVVIVAALIFKLFTLPKQ